MRNRDKDKHEEIDLVELMRLLWGRRRFILRVAGAVVFAGLFLALFGEVKYTAGSVIVPQTGKNVPGGNLQGLAAIAGINFAAAEQGELLSPMIYPMVVASVPFRKQLIYTEITVEGHDEPVTLLAYFTEKGYRKFSLFPFLKIYTIGLPGLVMGAIKGSGEPPAPTRDTIETLTRREYRCMKILSKHLTVTVNEKNGYISLSATMPEPLMAAQVAARAQELLQEYITRFKIEKVKANLDFVEARFLEVKADFEAKQGMLARFRDANRDMSSAVARTREASLENEYDLAFSIYSEMARQREQASIKVKEDTPTFTVVEPVTVPPEKSSPKRMLIVTVSLLLGLLLGAGLALVPSDIVDAFRIRPQRKQHSKFPPKQIM